MSTYCEICEDLVMATSVCPAADICAVCVGKVTTKSAVFSAYQVGGVLVGSALAEDAVQIDAYAILLNSGAATSSVSMTTVATDLLLGAARASSSATINIFEMAHASGLVTDEILAASTSQLLVSAAQAISSIPHGGVLGNQFLGSSGHAVSSASIGLSELLNASGEASSVVAILQRRVSVDALSTADGTSTVEASGDVDTFMLLATANGTSLVQLQNSTSVYLRSEVSASDGVYFRDTGAKAWVMNTETTAVSWYDNYDFESIAEFAGNFYAVGPEGLYVLQGATDDEIPINASVSTGFSDFGAPQTKRLDNMYFGYTSEGQIAVQAEVYESGSPPVTYLLEERQANSPRNSRVTPGKGLWGRYWRLTVKNVDGANFEVSDASVDIAVSPRRI